MSEYIVQAADWAIDYKGESLFKECQKIVRCSDCEHASFDEFGIGWCDENCREVKPWDFCSWGDRHKIDDSVIDDRFCSLFDRYIIDGICAWEERKKK